MQFVLLIKIATASLKQISYSMVENMCLFCDYLIIYLFLNYLCIYLILFVYLLIYYLFVYFCYLFINLFIIWFPSAISVPVRFMSVPVRLPFQYDACVSSTT
jgi:hypothetical protein